MELELEEVPIESDLAKSLGLPPDQLEDYLLILPLQFRFLRKDSPLLQN